MRTVFRYITVSLTSNGFVSVAMDCSVDPAISVDQWQGLSMHKVLFDLGALGFNLVGIRNNTFIFSKAVGVI